MPPPVTVVISCAGTGSRLGLGITKALVEIHGRPLIHWQLALLEDVADIRIVIGHEARRVIDTVRPLRPDAIFVMNDEYRTTGTAASLSLALRGVDPGSEIVSLDGDLLVDPVAFAEFLHTPGGLLGLVEPASAEPVYALMDVASKSVIGFTRVVADAAGAYEWSGLCRVDHAQLMRSIDEGVHRGHVYQMLASRLPLPYALIDAQEIDTAEDFARAVEWVGQRRMTWGKSQ